MIATWLRSDGVLYVEVPNIETYCREKSRGNMFHWGHIYNFNPWTLRAAAGLAGLHEIDETRARNADTTGAFFERGVPTEPEAAINPENGTHVVEMIRRHYAGAFREGKTVKPFAKLLARIEETATGVMMGSPRQIGEAVARKMGAGAR